MSVFAVTSDVGRFLGVLSAAGVLAGGGIFLAFDIVWVHWIFGLHHLTNSPEDLVRATVT